MDKNDIIEYVMNTPHNTNRAVLSNMLNQLTEGGGEEPWTVLTEESVTTAIEQGASAAIGLFAYSERITADTIKVTFNGTEYTCNKIDNDGVACYGVFDDFSEYPFLIESSESGNYLDTESAGTYTIKIEAPQGSGSSDFSTAEVTIVNTTIHPAKFECPVVLPNDNLSVSTLVLANGGIITVNAILYKGISCNEIVIIDTVTNDLLAPSNMSGNVSYDDDEMTYTITGDCTITIGQATSTSA